MKRRIAVTTGSGIRYVSALVYGIYAVHQPADGVDDGWRVTHVPTGLRFDTQLHLAESEATRAAMLLAERLPDLTLQTCTRENCYIAESCFAEALA